MISKQKRKRLSGAKNSSTSWPVSMGVESVANYCTNLSKFRRAYTHSVEDAYPNGLQRKRTVLNAARRQRLWPSRSRLRRWLTCFCKWSLSSQEILLLLKNWRSKILSNLKYLKSRSHKSSPLWDKGRLLKQPKKISNPSCSKADQFSKILFQTKDKGFLCYCQMLMSTDFSVNMKRDVLNVEEKAASLSIVLKWLSDE